LGGRLLGLVPAAGDVVPTGTPISVFFGQPAAPDSMDSDTQVISSQGDNPSFQPLAVTP
jgi:hypothetical protein